MSKRAWWGLGGGAALLALAIARATWLQRHIDLSTAPRAEIRLWLWLPPQTPDGWIVVLVLGAAASFLWALVMTRRRRTTPPAPTPRTVGSSAFAMDPWTDTAPVDLSQSAQTPAEQVDTLRHVAQSLERRGRLRAAREVYRQAYDLARATPSLQAEADDLLLALRKVERRLAQRRYGRTGWWWAWLRGWRHLGLVVWWGLFGPR